MIEPFRRMDQRRNEEEARGAAEQRALEAGRTHQLELTRQPQARLDANRRKEARSQCDLLYTLHEIEIRDRFNRAALDAYMQKYMGDAESPETVEQRSAELRAIIHQHREKVAPTPKFRSIQELAVWFEQRKVEIEAVSDDRHRATLLVQLKERYSELTSQLLAEMTP